MPEAQGPQPIENFIVNIAVALVILLLIVGMFGSFFMSVTGGYLDIVSWFYTRNWQTWYFVITIIVMLCDGALLWAAFSIAKRYYQLRKEAPQEEIASHLVSPQQEFQQNWQDIRELMNSSNPSDWNMAILRADAQLDDTLLHLGYEGETIADRLRIVDPTKLQSMDRLWSAHRLRNAIAHDLLHIYTREMIMHALESYEIAFRELGMLRAAPPVPENIQESMPMK